MSKLVIGFFFTIVALVSIVSSGPAPALSLENTLEDLGETLDGLTGGLGLGLGRKRREITAADVMMKKREITATDVMVKRSISKRSAMRTPSSFPEPVPRMLDLSCDNDSGSSSGSGSGGMGGMGNVGGMMAGAVGSAAEAAGDMAGEAASMAGGAVSGLAGAAAGMMGSMGSMGMGGSMGSSSRNH